jgi:hypothetical protein
VKETIQLPIADEVRFAPRQAKEFGLPTGEQPTIGRICTNALWLVVAGEQSDCKPELELLSASL